MNPFMPYLVKAGDDYFQLSTDHVPTNYAMLMLLDDKGNELGPVVVYEHINGSATSRVVTSDPSMALYQHAVHIVGILKTTLPVATISICYAGPKFRHAGNRWAPRKIETDPVIKDITPNRRANRDAIDVPLTA